MNIIKPGFAIEERDEKRGGLAIIERAAWTCYKTEDRIAEGSAERMVRMLIQRHHEAMLEHGDYIFLLDDYKILDNIVYSLRRLMENGDDVPMLTWTNINERPIISGNIRAWRELLASRCGAAYYFTGAIDPIYTADLFPDDEREMDTRIKQIHYSDLQGFMEKRVHLRQTVRFIVDRGVTHEFVRHRVMSFAQESTRYCIAGNMALTFSEPHNRKTVEQLYQNRVESHNGAWKRMRIRQYNEATGELEYAGIREIVYNGKRECVRIKTKLGYELVCTPDHRVLTPDGYVEAVELVVGSGVYVNGTAELYKNREWLFHQSITLNKTFVEISKEFGFNISTLKAWARKLKIPKKGTGYFHIGRAPWNKGITDERQAEALRNYHHCGRRKEGIMKEDTVNYQKHMRNECIVCGKQDALEVHHADKSHDNNDPQNLVTVCESCHRRIHSQNLLTAYADEVVSITDAGTQDVYDIEMDSEFHNFAANGVIVHNCDYSNGKQGNGITVIEPSFMTEHTEPYDLWKRQCMSADTAYVHEKRLGLKPEQARTVLPQSTKAELVMTGTLGHWDHFFDMRARQTTGPAHPQAAEVAIPLMQEMAVRFPDVIRA